MPDKALSLLGEACDINPYSSLGRLSIGERDARLLILREWIFGKRLLNTASCPSCNEITEWETDTTQLHLQPLPEELAVRTFNLEQDGYTIRFRLPDSNDIAKVMLHGEEEKAYRDILSACVLDANHNGSPVTTVELPISITETINRRMAEEDPQADIRMNIKCPACQQQWDARFDIASFLWAEINNWAQRMLREIYLLAKNFGWSEADILNMNPRRRQIYLQLLGA